MHVYTFLLNAFVPLYLAMGLYSLWLNPREASHRIFFLLSLAVGLWNFISGFIVITSSVAEAWFWFRLASAAGICFFPLLVHYCAALAKTPHRLWLVTGVYALSVPVHLRNLFATYIFGSIDRVGGSWILTPAFGSFWLYYWIVYELTVAVISLVILWFWRRRARTLRERKQAFTISCAVFLAFGYGFIEAYVIAPLLRLTAMSPLYVAFILFGTWWAMYRYRLLAVTDKKVSRDLLESMDVFILMLDAEERVVMANAAAEKLLARPRRELLGRPFQAVIGEESPDCQEALTELKDGRLPKAACQISLPGRGHKDDEIRLALKLSIVRDAVGDPLGFMALGEEIKGLRHFLRRFQITPREWEAIHQLVSGATNREIAGSLGIAERTVKAHLSNIYGKLGVENKVQTIAVLKEHGLY